MKAVRDVMARMPETLRPDDTIHKAARMMRDGDYGAIPIVDDRGVDDAGVLVGIVTDRDIVLKAVAEGRDGNTPIRHCMTPDPETAMPDTPLAQVLIVMTARQVRRLPVVEYGRLVGMIALADIAASDLPEDQKARALEDISAGGEHRPAGTAFDN